MFSSALFADELLKEGGFESPNVTARSPIAKGGDLSHGGKGPFWVGFHDRAEDKSGGPLTAGLTNEQAHGGAQSIYIEFAHVKQPYQAAVLQSRLFPVVPGGDYRVGIWGRLDAQNSIKLGGRTAYIKVQIDFFSKDGSEPVGETVYAVYPIPGSKNRPALFTTDKWSLFSSQAGAPPDAGFAQVTWQWETSSEQGETNGVIYFDDASFAGPPPADPNAKPVGYQLEMPTEEMNTAEDAGTSAASPSPAPKKP